MDLARVNHEEGFEDDWMLSLSYHVLHLVATALKLKLVDENLGYFV